MCHSGAGYKIKQSSANHIHNPKGQANIYALKAQVLQEQQILTKLTPVQAYWCSFSKKTKKLYKMHKQMNRIPDLQTWIAIMLLAAPRVKQ